MLTYSHYEHGHTLKILMGVTPGGLISFVSKVYGGRASGQAILEQSNLIEKCDPFTDAVMVDESFQIYQVCAANHVEVIRPPFLRKDKKFSEENDDRRQCVAGVCADVQRIISRLMLFKLFSEEIPWDFAPFIDDIVSLVCGIINFSLPMLADKRFMECVCN